MTKNQTCSHTVLLQSLIEKKRVPHLMLFSGSFLPNMRLCALHFAQNWLQAISENALSFSDSSIHPDIHLAATEGKLSLHSIATIRQITEKMAYSPYQAAGKVFIIEGAERMLPTSANALLKSLEEPLGKTVIILTTTKEEQLLATIRSRCVKIAIQDEIQKHTSRQDYSTLVEKLAPKTHFTQVAAAAVDMAQALDDKKRLIVKEINSFYAASMKEMNAHQKQKLEQEIEGAATAKWSEEVEHVLKTIFELYRDRVACDHAIAEDQLFFSADVQRISSIPLETVDEALSFAKLAVERSTPLQNVFESLLYKLSYLK